MFFPWPSNEISWENDPNTGFYRSDVAFTAEELAQRKCQICGASGLLFDIGEGWKCEQHKYVYKKEND